MGTKVLMTNVRMSEKSRRGYARILPVIGLALTKVSEFGVQSDSDRQRLIDLGISPNRVTRTGSMKFETNLPPSLREVAEAVRRDWGRDRSVIVCGSTHDGEESLLLGLFKDLSKQFPQTLLVLAPRHPERFDQVARLTVRSGFNMVRRSQQHGPIPDSVSVQIADTMGELAMLYAAADIAIVGGSLIRIKGIGGHNILEPCAVGVPVIFGPYMRNFSEISQLALARQAGFQIDGRETLKAQVCTLLRDADLRATTGENGIRMVSENTGATDCTLKLILPYLNQRN
jgi:3-deoxy-D-manno-octulosonic-acid transferase